jgi:hypothetical protein
MRKTFSFNPVDFGFEWDGDWYKFDGPTANEAAKKARDAFAKKCKDQGIKVKKSTDRNQLMSKGGIGSGRPHIEVVVTVFHATILEDADLEKAFEIAWL